jgi:hypothetical protein
LRLNRNQQHSWQMRCTDRQKEGRPEAAFVD